jgi:hypothetical protein
MSTVRQHLAPLPIPSAARCRCAAEDCSGICDPSPAPRAGLLARMVRATVRRARIACLRFDISSHEQYLAQCERDGIVVSDTIVDWTYALQDKRAELRALELQA